MKKTILVTGGSGVIGSSILRHFYKKGFNVVAAAGNYVSVGLGLTLKLLQALS